MTPWQRTALGVVIVAVLTAGAVALLVRDDEGAAVAPSVTTTTTEASTTTTSTSTTTTIATTTTAPPIPWPDLPADRVARAVRTPNGVVLAVLRANPDGTFLARSPCGGEVTVSGSPLSGATVVLDPGHGGEEPGAVGPAGTLEKAVNLAVAIEAKAQLEDLGATVVLTRTGDYRITLASRRAIVEALDPMLFVSIHHNAEPDGPHDGPGAETYFQVASPASKRAAGLLYEELADTFSTYDIAWVADTDAGAKYRRRSDGTDYYGILRVPTVPSVLSEAAFISNPPEEQLLADPEFQAVEAAAIARAIVRYASTEDPGTGFVEPYPRTQPAGPGGGSDGCVDPPLG